MPWLIFGRSCGHTMNLGKLSALSPPSSEFWQTLWVTRPPSGSAGTAAENRVKLLATVLGRRRAHPVSAAVPTSPAGGPHPANRDPSGPTEAGFPRPWRGWFPGQPRPAFCPPPSPSPPASTKSVLLAGTEGGGDAVRWGPGKHRCSVRDRTPCRLETSGGTAALPTPRRRTGGRALTFTLPPESGPNSAILLNILSHGRSRRRQGKTPGRRGGRARRGAAAPAPAPAEGFWPREGESPALTEQRSNRPPLACGAEPEAHSARGRRAEPEGRGAPCAGATSTGALRTRGSLLPRGGRGLLSPGASGMLGSPACLSPAPTPELRGG